MALPRNRESKDDDCRKADGGTIAIRHRGEGSRAPASSKTQQHLHALLLCVIIASRYTSLSLHIGSRISANRGWTPPGVGARCASIRARTSRSPFVCPWRSTKDASVGFKICETVVCYEGELIPSSGSPGSSSSPHSTALRGSGSGRILGRRL